MIVYNIPPQSTLGNWDQYMHTFPQRVRILSRLTGSTNQFYTG